MYTASMTLNNPALKRREKARQKDGKFGQQPRPAAPTLKTKKKPETGSSTPKFDWQAGIYPRPAYEYWSEEEWADGVIEEFMQVTEDFPERGLLEKRLSKKMAEVHYGSSEIWKHLKPDEKAFVKIRVNNAITRNLRDGRMEISVQGFPMVSWSERIKRVEAEEDRLREAKERERKKPEENAPTGKEELTRKQKRQARKQAKRLAVKRRWVGNC